jgi:hypothetical protein
VTSKADDLRSKAAEYERLAEAAAEPEAKRKLKELAKECRQLADAAT